MRTFTVVPSFEGESAFFELPDIGFQGDHLSFAILFNLTELMEHWPNVVPSMIVTDPKGNTFLAPNTSWNAMTHIFTWNISSAETAYEGYLKCQLKCTAADDPDTIVAMSRICQTRVYASLAAASNPPEAFQSWIDTLVQLGADVSSDANVAMASAEASEVNARAAQAAADDAELAKNSIDAARISIEQTASVAQSAQTGAVAAQQRAVSAAAAAEAAQSAAETAQSEAAVLLEETDTQAQAAASSASSAADSATQAASSMGGANTAKLAAEAARDAAINAKAGAETAQGLAEAAQTASETAQGLAEDAQTAAETAQGFAEAAQTAAETAQGFAEAAQTASETAQGLAEAAQTASETAQGLAEASQTAAETAQAAAETAESNSEANAELAKKWSVGLDSNDTDVGSQEPMYHNNSKYWAEQAASDASSFLNQKGVANGIATLDNSGKVPSSQLPSYVDDVVEYSSMQNFPAEGETGKIYVDTTANLSYRWSGSTYVAISSPLALGETSDTAYRGDRGAAAYTHAVTNKGSAFVSGLYKIETNSEGHVTGATTVQKSDITNLGIPGQDTTYSEMTGATSELDGTAGLVPAPDSGDQSKFLKGDGTWRSPEEDYEASGHIVSFDTFESPLKSLTVAIEPVQDLHGYDSPWPAGGGVNLCPPMTALLSEYIRVDFETVQSYTLSFYGSLGKVMIRGYDSELTQVARTSGATTNPRTITKSNFTSDVTGNVDDIVYIRINCYENTVEDITNAWVQFEEGSTATAYEPYSNICPITGWTGANVTRTGKNLYDKTITGDSGRYINESGGLSNSANYTASGFQKVVPDTDIVISGVGANSTNIRTAFYSTNSTSSFISAVTQADNSFTTHVPPNAHYCRISIRSGSEDTVQIELGSTASAFEAFAGNTYAVSFPTPPGTVYGGTLDVTTGVLTVTHASELIKDVPWNYTTNSGGYFRAYSSNVENIVKLADAGQMDALCSCYKTVQAGTSSALEALDKVYIAGGLASVYRLIIKDTDYTTVSDFVAARGEERLTYELRVPITYQLTNQQVIQLLEGRNVLWSDTGDILSLKYYSTQIAYHVDRNEEAISGLQNYFATMTLNQLMAIT